MNFYTSPIISSLLMSVFNKLSPDIVLFLVDQWTNLKKLSEKSSNKYDDCLIDIIEDFIKKVGGE